MTPHAPRDDIVACVAGESGDGILTGGELLARSLARLGYHTLTFPTYPAEIRGGPCAYRLRASPRPVHTIGSRFDILLALNREAVERHYESLRPDGLLCYEATDVHVEPASPRQDLPLRARARVAETLRTERPLNVYAIAAVSEKLGVPRETLESVVRETFTPRGPAVLENNLRAVGLAYEDMGRMPLRLPRHVRDLPSARDLVPLNGNHAVVLGALAAGCTFFAGYPITPASPILDEMTRLLPRAGGTCIQVEDELAALGAALGAGFAGARSMTATSGPGLSLMFEMLGLAVMAEVPVVLSNVQRAGPATGMPTRPEQGDLWGMVFGGHGEAPRLVVAPTDVADAFTTTQWAFDLAERYQVPVILATDAYLAHRVENVPRALLRQRRAVPPRDAHDGTDYQRYRITDDFRSPRATPGEAGRIHFAESLEHDENGAPSYDGAVHEAMNEKRRAKLEPIRDAPEAVVELGAPGGEDLLVAWGGSSGAAREVVAGLPGWSGMLVRLLEPLPTLLVDRARSARRVVVVENNPSGQLAFLLEAACHRRVERMNEARGEPVPAERILARLQVQEVAHG